MKSFFPHQNQAFTWALERDKIALFMEMRLGKTLVALRWAQEKARIDEERVLIIAPLSVIAVWREELLDEIFAEEEIHDLHAVPTSERGNYVTAHGPGWYLINYEAIRGDPTILDFEWKVLILDESTAIRNPKAQITKLLTKFTGHIPHRAILSGLPNPENTLDYFCQMRFLFGSWLGTDNFWIHRQTMFRPDYMGYAWNPKSGTMDRIKQEVHRQAFVLTRQAAGMGERKVFEVRRVPMNPIQKRMYKEVMKTWSSGGIDTKWAPTQALWLSRIAGGFDPHNLDIPISQAKCLEIYNLLTGDLKGQQLVVWFRFVAELKWVVQFLRKKRFRVAGMWGGTPTDERVAQRRMFADHKMQILCIQEKVGKVGIDLSAADTAIYYSNDYELEARAQSQDRIIHPIKKRPLLYIDLVTEDSIDETAIQALRDKRVTARTFMMSLIQKWEEIWHGKTGH